MSNSKRIKHDVVALMHSAGISPELIYAYKRTGFILTEDTYKSLSIEDKSEYDAAIEEYRTKSSKP